jgi:macrodomain Ter protein organizer (MatP/YcbG family)
MASPDKFKSLSVPIAAWQKLGLMANRTNRTRSKMIERLIRFFEENKGEKRNVKSNGSKTL